MTVAVQHDALLERWRRITGPVFSKEFRQRKRLFRQAARVLIVGKEIDELIAEDRQAARLEHDDRRAGFEVRPQSFEGLAEQLLGLPEKTVVIQRPTAAERSRRPHHVAANGL